MCLSYVGTEGAKPNARTLLLSSTNVAIDLAILEIANAAREARLPLQRIYRFGARLDPARFQNCSELVPLRDRELITNLKRHLQDIPSTIDPERYAVWKARRNELQQQIDDQNQHFLTEARLVAMTTSLAAREYRRLGHFDLVLFDEASQVNKVHAVTFAPLGKRVLFAGDAHQLSPIAQASAKHDDVAAWLQCSPLDWMARVDLGQDVCFLDEQSRMAPAICEVVSRCFYKGLLRVAKDVSDESSWQSARAPLASPLIGRESVVLVRVLQAARVAPGFRGYQCEESARYALAIAAEQLRRFSDPAEAAGQVILLTPFVAQRRRFEAELRSWGWPTRLASTVHRAQGSEADLVVFDPVAPESEFVSSMEGQKLFNVAMSRAKSRLVIFCHPGWRTHRLLQALANRVPPISLEEDTVARLLASPPRPSPSPPKSASPAPRMPLATTSFERFKVELDRQSKHHAPSPGMIKRLALHLHAKSEFKKLSWMEVDKAIEEVYSSQRRGAP